MTKPRLYLPLLLLTVGLTGCLPKKEVVYAPAGDAAPAFGSSAETQTLQAFIVGQWAVARVGDPQRAKQLNLPADFGQTTVNKDHKYDFKADGTFKTRTPRSGAVIAGTWTADAKTVTLKYLTINDKTIEAVTAETKAMAERGAQAGLMNDMILDNIKDMAAKMSQLSVAPDKKRLMFNAGGAAVTDPMSMGASYGLERLVPEKS